MSLAAAWRRRARRPARTKRANDATRTDAALQKACAAFAREIAPALIGRDCRDQAKIDGMLVELDGSPQHSRLGGNTLIATSLAVLQTAAAAAREPLWRFLAIV